jgi:DNA-binding MarR family transcriptional regulator
LILLNLDYVAIQILTIISIVIIAMAMDENLGTMIADVSRLMRRSFNARARSVGVTRPQWQVLTVLIRNEGIHQGALAEKLEVEPMTVCRMVDRLQEAGLIERRADPDDRRSWLLFATEKTHVMAEKLRPLADDMLSEALDGIGNSDQVRLMEMLAHIRLNLTNGNEGLKVANG